jgi:hypothetical protein
MQKFGQVIDDLDVKSISIPQRRAIAYLLDCAESIGTFTERGDPVKKWPKKFQDALHAIKIIREDCMK